MNKQLKRFIWHYEGLGLNPKIQSATPRRYLSISRDSNMSSNYVNALARKRRLQTKELIPEEFRRSKNEKYKQKRSEVLDLKKAFTSVPVAEMSNVDFISNPSTISVSGSINITRTFLDPYDSDEDLDSDDDLQDADTLQSAPCRLHATSHSDSDEDEDEEKGKQLMYLSCFNLDQLCI